MDEVIVNRKDLVVMKLLHYFITVKNYSPIILQGAEDEIWLENLDSEYQIIRIVSNYLHNDEQLGFDQFRAKKISNKISRKVFSYHMNILNIYTDLGDNVHLEGGPRMDVVSLYEDSDILKNSLLIEKFPDMKDKLTYNEEGVELFIKITNDINKKNQVDAKQADEVFSKKEPIITYLLILVNILCYLVTLFASNGEKIVDDLCLHGDTIRNYHEYYRLVTCAFFHVDIIHILFNVYALYIIGSQMESFIGKTKFIIVYFASILTASLMSITLNNAPSIGASGAIFGLMGSMLVFGYHYRVYLGTVLRSQIVPLIVFNLMLGFMVSGIDNFAHIGGLLGGILVTYALGIKYKSSKVERINGTIIFILFTAFITYMGLFMER